jgi:hypothetical protein
MPTCTRRYCSDRLISTRIASLINTFRQILLPSSDVGDQGADCCIRQASVSFRTGRAPVYMKKDIDRQSSNSLRRHTRRITIFEVIWVAISLVGGLVVGSYIADVFAIHGSRLFGNIGGVISSVLGLLVGLVIAGILSWVLIGTIVTAIVRVLDYRDRSNKR